MWWQDSNATAPYAGRHTPARFPGKSGERRERFFFVCVFAKQLIAFFKTPMMNAPMMNAPEGRHPPMIFRRRPLRYRFDAHRPD